MVIMFYGAWCPHCKKTIPHVNKLIKEGYNIEKLEVWENEENAKNMRKLKNIITPFCGDGLGVPAFVDIQKNKALCGEQTYKNLKKWMKK